MGIEEAKAAAGRRAAMLIENGMIVGLGSGSTAAYFIDALIHRVNQGLRISAVASSNASAKLASQGGIRVLDINAAPKIDMTVDGADEIDQKKQMIKGGGGAHTREKILAAASHEMVVIVDETKLVNAIGQCKLPVEILHFGSPITRNRLENQGYKGQWRINADGSLFLTDNGNPIFDIRFDFPPANPEEENEQILRTLGVIDTGFFFHLAGRVLIGHLDGTVEMR